MSSEEKYVAELCSMGSFELVGVGPAVTEEEYTLHRNDNESTRSHRVRFDIFYKNFITGEYRGASTQLDAHVGTLDEITSLLASRYSMVLKLVRSYEKGLKALGRKVAQEPDAVWIDGDLTPI